LVLIPLQALLVLLVLLALALSFQAKIFLSLLFAVLLLLRRLLCPF